ncbi:MAG: carboxypeptidase regulatory-like domain-containing protein [Planctomycetes bacterium]|nr:carboxypeptidase regulatory-like domain-containing protein [Planctomycetota bacterium]
MSSARVSGHSESKVDLREAPVSLGRLPDDDLAPPWTNEPPWTIEPHDVATPPKKEGIADRPGRVHGRVHFSNDPGRTAAGLTVLLYDDHGEELPVRSTAVSDPDGEFSFDGLPPGRYAVDLDLENSPGVTGSMLRSFRLSEGAGYELTIAVRSATLVSGILTHSDGSPAMGRVLILDLGGRNEAELRTDAQGRFQDTVVLGRERPTIFVDQFAGPVELRTLDRSEGTTNLDLVLPPVTDLELTVVDPDGVPLAAASVRIEKSRPGGAHETRLRNGILTDLDGICTFAGLFFGTYDVEVDRSGYVSVIASIELREATSALEIELTPIPEADDPSPTLPGLRF